MIHPKHFVELDAIPEKFSRMGKFDGLRLNADMVNEDGFPTSIVVEIGGDEHAALQRDAARYRKLEAVAAVVIGCGAKLKPGGESDGEKTEC